MLGSPRLRHADVRVIAASNLNLLEETKNGNFRLDLYHRLNVVPIDLPPLRERVEDIPLLARHFLVRHSEEMGVPAPKIPARVMDLLLMYDWPGNVRELEHVIQRALILSKGSMLDRLPPCRHTDHLLEAGPRDRLSPPGGLRPARCRFPVDPRRNSRSAQDRR